METCPGCGSRDCATMQTVRALDREGRHDEADTVRTRARERRAQIEANGGLFGLIASVLAEDMPGQFDSPFDNPFSALRPMPLEMSRMSGIGQTPNRTLITIGEDGTMRRIRRGTKTETIPLAKIEGIDPDVVAAFEEFGVVAVDLSEKNGTIHRLTEESNTLERGLSGKRIDAEFALWGILPEDDDELHKLYGRDGLELREEDEQFVLYDNGERVKALGKETAQAVFNLFTAIETDENTIRNNLMRIQILQQETNVKPRLLERKREVATALLNERTIPVLTKSDPNITEIEVNFDESGTSMITITSHIDERDEAVTAGEQALLEAFGTILAERGETKHLLPKMREALGLPEEKEPLVETAGQTVARRTAESEGNGTPVPAPTGTPSSAKQPARTGA